MTTINIAKLHDATTKQVQRRRKEGWLNERNFLRMQDWDNTLMAQRLPMQHEHRNKWNKRQHTQQSTEYRNRHGYVTEVWYYSSQIRFLNECQARIPRTQNNATGRRWRDTINWMILGPAANGGEPTRQSTVQHQDHIHQYKWEQTNSMELTNETFWRCEKSLEGELLNDDTTNKARNDTKRDKRNNQPPTKSIGIGMKYLGKDWITLLNTAKLNIFAPTPCYKWECCRHGYSVSQLALRPQ